jgi:hypothetical protein
MSSPINNGDKLEVLQLYAPPWAREQAPSTSRAQPQPPALQPAQQPAAAPQPAATQADAQQLTPLQPAQPAASPPPPLFVPSSSRSRVLQPRIDDFPSAAPDLGEGVAPTDASSAGSLAPERLDPEQVAKPGMVPERRPARIERQVLLPGGSLSSDKTDARMAPGLGGPNLDWRPSRIQWSVPAVVQQPPGQNELAVRALRQRLSLDPEFVPAPPNLAEQKSLMPLVGRLGLVAVFAATVAYAVTFYSVVDPGSDSIQADSGSPDQITVGAADSSATQVTAARQMMARLAVEGRQALANEPMPLGVSLIGTARGEVVHLSGLAAGTKLSVGSPLGDTGWRVAARELPGAVAYAPKDFVGVMNAAVDLRGANDAILDRNVARLEWVGRQPDARGAAPRVEQGAPRVVQNVAARPGAAAQAIDKDELDTLLKRGAEYMKGGDYAAARLMLQRAASSGSSQAALALGATYDPLVFIELGVVGFGADLGQARYWYEQARKLGSNEATQRLDRLTRFGR